LGGVRSVLLMQSSGVGNIVNALATVRECRFPLTVIVTMRGENGEFNPWQVPMGQATDPVLRAMGAVVHRVDDAADVAGQVEASLRIAHGSYCAAAVLVGQRVIGIKSFQEQANQ
jgi:sulfopyruvate decarboxylase TPP-binding subunit